MASIPITGRPEFIGNHACLNLLDAGKILVIGLLDNFVVSSPEILRRVLEMTDVEANDHLKVVEGGICSAEGFKYVCYRPNRAAYRGRHPLRRTPSGR